MVFSGKGMINPRTIRELISFTLDIFSDFSLAGNLPIRSRKVPNTS